MSRPRWFQGASWLLLALLAASHSARADDDRRGAGVALLPAYQQECAACHVAFPPGMLPSNSWRRLLSNLPRHFGTDASLDAAAARELADWLSANAGTYKQVREAPPEDRITKAVWFVRRHHEVPAAAWQRPAVKSPSNCAACHAQAAQGDFSEHNVRIPR